MTIHSQLQRLAACVVLAGGPALAQTATPPLNSVPEQIAPGAKPVGPAQSLSDKLKPSNGVIDPKEVDPAIKKPAPKVLDPNVVPPSVTPDASQTPQPK